MSRKINRYPVTVRLNVVEHSDLAALCEFWRMDEKQIIKLAFAQLVKATRDLNNKLKEEQNEQANNNPGDGAGTSNSGDNQTGTEDAPVADTGATGLASA